MKKPLIITIITVIILALIGGGVFWYLKTQKNENNDSLVAENEDNNLKKEQENNESEKEVVNDGEEIDTSDWLTYRNEEYGFELKYQEDASFKVNQDFLYNLQIDLGQDIFFVVATEEKNEQIIKLTSGLEAPVIQLGENPFFIPSNIWQEDKEILNSKDLKNRQDRFIENNYVVSYRFFAPIGEYIRTDSVYKDNIRYSFITFFSGEKMPKAQTEEEYFNFLNNKYKEFIKSEFSNDNNKNKLASLMKIKEFFSFID